MRTRAGGTDEAVAARPDLSDRAQIHDLVVGFYREIVFDDLLGPVFDDVAEVDWTVHLPKLVDYWCQVLLGEPGYAGWLLGPHQAVSDRERFRAEHFDRWYGLWTDSIGAGWAGPVAETAKAHAARIAAVLARRVAGLDWAPTDS